MIIFINPISHKVKMVLQQQQKHFKKDLQKLLSLKSLKISNQFWLVSLKSCDKVQLYQNGPTTTMPQKTSRRLSSTEALSPKSCFFFLSQQKQIAFEPTKNYLCGKLFWAIKTPLSRARFTCILFVELILMLKGNCQVISSMEM